MRDKLKERRTCRYFTDEPVPQEVIEAAIEAAGTAPNGANHQPWHFAVVSSPDKKRAIREAAEAEEKRKQEEETAFTAVAIGNATLKQIQIVEMMRKREMADDSSDDE